MLWQIQCMHHMKWLSLVIPNILITASGNSALARVKSSFSVKKAVILTQIHMQLLYVQIGEGGLMVQVWDQWTYRYLYSYFFIACLQFDSYLWIKLWQGKLISGTSSVSHRLLCLISYQERKFERNHESVVRLWSTLTKSRR